MSCETFLSFWVRNIWDTVPTIIHRSYLLPEHCFCYGRIKLRNISTFLQCDKSIFVKVTTKTPIFIQQERNTKTKGYEVKPTMKAKNKKSTMSCHGNITTVQKQLFFTSHLDWSKLEKLDGQQICNNFFSGRTKEMWLVESIMVSNFDTAQRQNRMLYEKRLQY